MKKMMLGTIAAMLAMAAFGATSTPQGFTDNLDEALKSAKANKRYVVAVFSGSDWCGWCKKLEKEILSTETFRKGAVGRYELVYIDNPRNQDLLSEHGKENNRKLTSKYDIHGFPTVLILDADGKKVAEMGYDAGGPEKYLEKIEEEVKYGPDIKKYINPIEEKLKGPSEAMQKEMQEAMKGIAKKYVAIYEQGFKDARAMKVPAHMEKRKEEVISKQERQFKRLKSFVEEKEK
jgi:protein disulfide-isomerase